LLQWKNQWTSDGLDIILDGRDEKYRQNYVWKPVGIATWKTKGYKGIIIMCL
jgi:hypothetical protein